MKLPLADIKVYDKEPQFIKNPFSGEGCMLTPEAIAVYDTLRGCEMFGDYKGLRKCLDWFRKYFPQEYMVLLD
jgi:hypothetical protein